MRCAWRAEVGAEAGRVAVVVFLGGTRGAGGGGVGLVICLHTALDDMPAESLSGQICPSPIVILGFY